MGAANGPRGLWITPEPAEPVSARSELLRA